jgi:SAM-dependent methyltransferase
MGVDFRLASLIVREHAWRPIAGTVLLLGRQTMFFTPGHAMGMVREAGLPVPEVDFHAESNTRLARESYISDEDFFRLLGVPQLRALDVSDYEGADIVHDLTTPIPDHLEGIADFILDGSTLDNVFDPATVLRNIARMLKPSGRLVATNEASNHICPYVIPTTHLVLDYFVINGFADCKPYIFAYDSDGGMNAFTPNLALMRKGAPQPQNFRSPHQMSLIVMAEKGPDSTWQHSPVQHCYRTEWDRFERNLAVIEASERPHVARSTVDPFTPNGEFLWVDQQGVARHEAVPVTETVPAPQAVPGIKEAPPDYRQVSGWTLLREISTRAGRRIGLA